MANRYLKGRGMDENTKTALRGHSRRKHHRPTLSQRDGDDRECGSQDDLGHLGCFGEIHPELFADEATRARLGFDQNRA